MANFKLTNKAVFDLNSIWEYTADKWSEYQADKYYKMLLDTFNDIANNPDLGKNYIGVSVDIFGLKAIRHIIFYRKLGNETIEITRIIHERMDLKNRISE